MLRRSLLFLLFVGVALGCDASPAPVPDVDGSEARRLVADGALLLDVRTAREYARGHAEPAIHIPVDELSARLDELPRDRPVITYCMAGARSARAAAVLRDAGFDVRDLGSLPKWEAAAGDAHTER